MAIQIPAASTTSVDFNSDAHDESKVMVSRVNENGAARVMAMLVNTYSDPHAAVIREYVANAVDATVMAGIEVPVEVTAPTALVPELRIVDSGVGMDRASIEGAFLAFAESTKGATNEAIGGLGIGAKSAWTICESFLVDTVKDGKRNVVRASRALKHEVLVDNAPTAADNGTTIVIPVAYSEVADWHAKISSVIKFHQPGRVKLDGEFSDHVHDDSWIGPVKVNYVHDTERPHDRKFHILSGGTVFEVPSVMYAEVRAALGVDTALIKLPIGSFQHIGNRDHIIAGAESSSALKVAYDEYRSALKSLSSKISRISKTNPTRGIEMLHRYVGANKSLIELPYVVGLNQAKVYVRRHLQSGRSVAWDATGNREGTPLHAAHIKLGLYGLVITDAPSRIHRNKVNSYLRWFRHSTTHAYFIESGEKFVDLPLRHKGEPPVEIAEGAELPPGKRYRISANTGAIEKITYAELIAKVDARARESVGSGTKSPRHREHHCAFISGGEVRKENLTLSAIKAWLKDNPNAVPLSSRAGAYHHSHFRDILADDQTVVIISPPGQCTEKWIHQEIGAVATANSYLTSLVRKAAANVTELDYEALACGSELNEFFRVFSWAKTADDMPESLSQESKWIFDVRDHARTDGYRQRTSALGRLVHVTDSYESQMSSAMEKFRDVRGSIMAKYPLLAVHTNDLRHGRFMTSIDAGTSAHIRAYVENTPPVVDSTAAKRANVA